MAIMKTYILLLLFAFSTTNFTHDANDDPEEFEKQKARDIKTPFVKNEI